MVNSIYSNLNDNPQRQIYGKVELYNGSTLLDTFKTERNTKLQEITVTRSSEHGKFFGFGICQQAVVKVIDKPNTLTVSKGYRLKTAFSANNTADTFTSVCPSFYVKEAHRDEKTSVITMTAYDALDTATSLIFTDLGIQAPYTIKDVAEACAQLLGLSVDITDSAFDTSYELGANFGGSENLRTVLNTIAEVTQTIYYVNHLDQLVFKRLDKTSEPVLNISKNNYFEFTTALPVTITNITSVTELGENYEGTDHSGVNQYIRDNPFWNGLSGTEVAALLDASIARINGLTIVPYNIKWRGNFITELGDKISIEAKDGSFITTYILDDTFTYTGGFVQSNSWEYNPDGEKNTATNPITLGDKLNQTFAKVDKVNRTVTLVASETEANTSALSTIQLDTASILAAVSSLETKVDNSVAGTADVIEEINRKVEATMTTEQIQLAISSEISKGTGKVETTTGFTFNEEGLSVSKSGSAISTTITENGMTVFKDNSEVLTANKDGVIAKDLHAETYLIIGTNSRFEDYENRTGCFWIGG
jgi:hypothetical protein